MRKRGQITIFVIGGIAALIIFGLVYYVMNYAAKKEITTSAEETGELTFDIMPVKNYAEACLKRTSEEGIWLIGLHGGYINTDANDFYDEGGTTSATAYLGDGVPYYLDETDDNGILELDEIEEKLSKYIIVEFEKCLDLEVFKGSDFTIAQPNVNYKTLGYYDSDLVKSEVSINEKDIAVHIKYPLNISTDSSKTKLEDFTVILPIRLKLLHDAAGILRSAIKSEWDDGDSENYDLSNFDCDSYDSLKQMGIYAKEDDDIANADSKIIRLVDYNPFYYKYSKAYVFQFAIKNGDPIEFEGSSCSATTP